MLLKVFPVSELRRLFAVLQSEWIVGPVKKGKDQHGRGSPMHLINELLAVPWQGCRQPVTPREGVGVGAVEAPRGILYHCFQFDPAGRIVKADCVIPTSQNHANICYDIEELAHFCGARGKSDTEIELLTEMLVRAHDPCISCSLH